jgi:CubicO group peptidase (beta-lactamase class C family)
MTTKGGFRTDGLERMRRVLGGYVSRGEVPGFVAVLSRRGETVVEVAGALSIGGASMARDSIFRIASLTKPVTAVAAMILVEECAIGLDEPVDRWLPELADRRVLRNVDGPVDDTVPARRPITPRDLLTLRMGLGYLMDGSGPHPIHHLLSELQLLQGPPRPASMPDPDEWMRRLGRVALMYQPGERWMYDIGHDVLGVLVSRVAGQPLGDFMRERIFAPLGMRDTGFHVPAGDLDRFATCYTPDSATRTLNVYDDARTGGWSRPPAFQSGSGSLVGTADDYLAFARMLMDGGAAPDGTRILSRPSVELMTTDQMTDAQKAAGALVPGFLDANGYGFGVSMVTRRTDQRSLGTYGWTGGLGTSWNNDPREGLTGLLLTQRAWESPIVPPIHRDFWTLAYAAIGD